MGAASHAAGVFSDLTTWAAAPFNSDMDLGDWALFTGLIIVLSVLLMYIISIRQEAESLVKKQINDMNNGTKITQEKMKNNVYIVKITPKKPLVELQQEKLFGLEYSLDQTIVLNVDDQI